MRLICLTLILTGTLWGQAGVVGSGSSPAAKAQAAPAAQVPAPPDAAKQMAAMQKKLDDWPQLGRYRDANAALGAPVAGVKRVVFYGDSITDAWGRRPDTGSFFLGEPYVNRGISGQTTPQMVVRFQQDVVHLKPAAVVILAGTNDIAGNTGPSTPEMIEDNFESMIAIARANGIKVVISSILPADHFSWKPGVQPAEQIRAMNVRLKAMCERKGLVYLDYYSAMANAQGGLDPDLAKDGVHPTAKGYAVMAPLAEKAIAEVLAR